MNSFTTYLGGFEIETSFDYSGKTISVAYDESGKAIHGTQSISIESEDSLRKMITKLT